VQFAKNPLCAVVQAWMSKINLGLEFKRKRFQKDADLGMKFLSGPADWMYGKNRAGREDRRYFDEDDGGDIPAPKFKMTVNKTAEMVQLFGPTLYHKNPNRVVTPRQVPVPSPGLVQVFGSDPATMMWVLPSLQSSAAARAVDQARADIMQQLLNFTPNALGLKEQSRFGIDEGIIKGAGVLWCEVWQTPTGQRMVGNFFDSVDNLVIDPDATSLEGAKWIARRRVQPVWEAERRFQLPAGTLKATSESGNRAAEVDSDPTGVANYLRQRGQTQDLITYWDVFSKTGVGGRLSTVDASYQQELDYYGDYAYLAVSNAHDWPLNVPDGLWDLEATQARQTIAERLRWHTPFWADGTWPCSVLGFHHVPNDPWPLSHLSPGMGELMFLNWAYSLMTGKLRITFRDFIVFLEECGEDVKRAVLHGADMEAIAIKGSQNKPITDLVSFLQHPPFNTDIFNVLDRVAEQFDKRVGLNELLYGQSSKQYRSAAEAEVKQAGSNIRPDDMAVKVEDWMAEAARKEAIASRWHLSGQDVLPILGPFGADLWNRLVVPTDPTTILYGLDYRIESGSVRKPNREKQAQNAKDALTTLLPMFQGLAQGGFVDPFNALIKFWGESIDLNTDAFTLNVPAPAAPPPAAGAPQSAPPQAA
jgi:hypothetical protein